MKVLMVCLGNICRSPLADGLLREKIRVNNLDVSVDSAGTSGHHSGEAPDPRMRATAKAHKLSIDDLRARQFSTRDFDEFDLIYVMDESNYTNVTRLARNEQEKNKVKLILNELTPGMNAAVPDPYYGGDQGFETVFSMLNKATDIIITKLLNE
jgi:protein-tyrosine phosphatase